MCCLKKKKMVNFFPMDDPMITQMEIFQNILYTKYTNHTFSPFKFETVYEMIHVLNIVKMSSF